MLIVLTEGKNNHFNIFIGLRTIIMGEISNKAVKFVNILS